MISDFPPDYELMGFFGAEPEILDPGVPWIYNTLTWEITKSDRRLRCTMSPSYRQAQLILAVGGKEILIISVGNVGRIYLDKRAGGEVLCLTRPPGEQPSALVLRLHPDIHIAMCID